MKTGIGGVAAQRRAPASRGRFTDTNEWSSTRTSKCGPGRDSAIGRLARGGASMDARANAARAVGILRGGAAVTELVDAIIPRIRGDLRIAGGHSEDPRSDRPAPRIAFLLHDLDSKVQIAAIQAAGLLLDKDRRWRTGRTC